MSRVPRRVARTVLRRGTPENGVPYPTTGLASIGEIGTASKDFTIVGPTVNMASRIQGEAKAGEVLASADVYRQVTHMFAKSDCRACQLKGIAEPVAVHSLQN